MKSEEQKSMYPTHASHAPRSFRRKPEAATQHATALVRNVGRVRFLARCGLLFLLLALSFAPVGKLFAQCQVDRRSPTQGIVTFNPPTTITVPANVAPNTVLWTSTEAAPSPTPVYDCYGTVKYGVQNNVGSNPAGGVRYFPTGIPNLSYVLTHDGNTMFSWPNDSENFGGRCNSNRCTGGETETFSLTTTLQLVATGPIASGSTLPAGTLAYWQWQGFNGSALQIEVFTLGNQVKFVTPSCSVTTNPVNVTLPTITTAALGGTGTTAGTVPFSIGLNCPGSAAGLTVSVELDNNGGSSSIRGVLLPTGGGSKGVGVQVLDKSSNPVTFGSPGAAGTTRQGDMNIPYYARYYQTGPITPGSLTASATFTLSYQ